MAELTGVSYAHHTFSPWWGCTKIGEECVNCYADMICSYHRYGVLHGMVSGPPPEHDYCPERSSRKV